MFDGIVEVEPEPEGMTSIQVFCTNTQKDIMSFIMGKVALQVSKMPRFNKNSSWGAEQFIHTEPTEIYEYSGKMGRYYRVIFNLYNTYWAIILPFLASATGTFVFRQHFLNIPTSLADAAKIDGATPLRFLWGILIPMSYNTIGAFAVIQFVYVWDQYLWPLVAIRDTERQVVQVGLRSLIATSEATRWEVVMAGAWISLIPPLLLFIFLQEQFSRGFALSDDK